MEIYRNENVIQYVNIDPTYFRNLQSKVYQKLRSYGILLDSREFQQLRLKVATQDTFKIQRVMININKYNEVGISFNGSPFFCY